MVMIDLIVDLLMWICNVNKVCYFKVDMLFLKFKLEIFKVMK